MLQKQEVLYHFPTVMMYNRKNVQENHMGNRLILT